jgi:hypothetical protein
VMEQATGDPQLLEHWKNGVVERVWLPLAE